MTSSGSRFQSSTPLATIVTAAHLPLAVACLALLVQLVAGVDMADRWTSSDETSHHVEALVSLDRYVLGLRLLAAVAFLVWLYRVTANVETFGEPTESPGLTVIFCVLPIVNLWKPYVGVASAWTGSAPEPAPRSATRKPVAPHLILVWWLITLFSFLVARIGAQITTASTADEWRSAHHGGLAGSALTLASAVLTVGLVWAITRRQARRAPSPLATATVVAR